MGSIDEMMTNKEAITLLIMMKRNASFWQCWAIDKAIEALKQPERKHGKWRVYEGEMTCLCCETTFYTDMCEYIDGNVPKFCPECGADMRGEE